MRNSAASRFPRVLAVSFALGLGATSVPAQPATGLRLTDAVRPPTRVIPGDEIELTVLDPHAFPVGGRWTIAGRTATPRVSDASATYRLSVTVPADFPLSWNRLPIVYADPAGRVVYDSGEDPGKGVALADIANLAPFFERAGRVSGASPQASPGELFCVCGFFPDRESRQGVRLGAEPLGPPVTASTAELWFEVPADAAAGRQAITGDPAAGFARGEEASIEIAAADPSRDGSPCPCAYEEGYLAEWEPVAPRLIPAGGDRKPDPVEPTIWLESLGGSTGEVLMAHVVNPGPGPLDLSGLFAVEPVSLSPTEKNRALEELLRAGGEHVEVKASFYCLQFGAAAPPAGVVYRIAPAARQERFQPAARALAAARRLRDAGGLSPDTSPESYFHSIRQWAVWTLEQSYDRDGFVAAFLEHTRKNVELSGREWTEEFAGIARRSAEGRWRDIRRVLEEAGLERPASGKR